MELCFSNEISDDFIFYVLYVDDGMIVVSSISLIKWLTGARFQDNVVISEVLLELFKRIIRTLVVILKGSNLSMNLSSIRKHRLSVMWVLPSKPVQRWSHITSTHCHKTLRDIVLLENNQQQGGVIWPEAKGGVAVIVIFPWL